MKSRWYLLICLVVVILAFIPFTRNYLSRSLLSVARPFNEFFSSVSYFSKNVFSGVSDISSLRSQNADLATKLRESQIDKNELEELKAENSILKQQLGFKEQVKDKELIPAKIISREPTTYLDNIIIDKGSSDGISSGMAVVSDGALVGKVSDVLANQSKVILITSKDSVIQAMLQQNRVTGIMRGGLSGLTLENIPQDVEISDKEGVVTSGLGGGIEQGILIGEATGQRSSKAEIFKILNIQPIVNFSKLEIVFVVK